MRWVLHSFPGLVLFLAGWVALGWTLARMGLRVPDRVRALALALPLGLVAHALIANALARALPLSAVARGLPWLELGVGALAFLRTRARAPAPAPAGDRAALLATALIGTVALGGGLYLHPREVFIDDTGHASMVHLLAAGQFPLRFTCNPELSASYSYGGNLLAAMVMIGTGLRPWEAMDLVPPAALAGALMLAFVSGWTPSRRVGCGLLAVGLLLTAGPVVWLLAPLSAFSAPEASWLGFLTKAARQLVESPWNLAVFTPGFIAPTYVHVQRSLSWVFAPLLLLLTLVVLEAVAQPRRRAVALGFLVAASALLHAAVLVILVPGLLIQSAVELWQRRSGGAAADPVLGGTGLAAVAAGLSLAALQGGMLTDALADRLHGVANAATTFTWAFPQLPSCRLRGISLGCAVLSALNLGVVPFCLPWLARSLWGMPGHGARRMLLLGAAFAYAVPLCFRYGYGDFNLQRVNAYATWTLAILMAPIAGEAFAAGGAARRVALGLLMLLAGGSGVVTAAMVVTGRGLQDAERQDFLPLPAPLDLAMMRAADQLPRDARFFDPVGCLTTTGTRPGYLFGRYLLASRDRGRFNAPLPAFDAVSRDPEAAALWRGGFTHLYIDGAWYEGLGDAGRAALERGPVAVMDAAREGGDFRALLRVCRPDEACPGFLPARDVPSR